VTAAEVSLAAIRAAADHAFPPERGAVVYADRVPRGPGPVQVGGEQLILAAPHVLVFRDEQPGANWMHACAYALVDVADGTVTHRAPSDRPPVFGLLPSTWVVASDPDGSADLVPPADADQED
jgi:hypothetical protein